MRLGQYVKVLGGMREFVGEHGVIVDDTERDGRTVMYRVRLDHPVLIPNVGYVNDDLWAGKMLKAVRAPK